MIRSLLFCIVFLLAACTNSHKRSAFKDCHLIIQCPVPSAYYSIKLNGNGAGTLGFCYEMKDSITFTPGNADPVVKVHSFQLSENDNRYVDSLVMAIPPGNKLDKQFGHDSFRYILILDGEVKIETKMPEPDIHALLNILIRYFPKDFETYDFGGYFKQIV